MITRKFNLARHAIIPYIRGESMIDWKYGERINLTYSLNVLNTEVLTNFRQMQHWVSHLHTILNSLVCQVNPELNSVTPQRIASCWNFKSVGSMNWRKAGWFQNATIGVSTNAQVLGSLAFFLDLQFFSRLDDLDFVLLPVHSDSCW